MKIQYQLLALICLALCCSGCVPWKFETSPGAKGIVLDSETHVPIAGAKVAISRTWYHSVSSPATNFPAWYHPIMSGVTNQEVRRFVAPTLDEALLHLQPPAVITDSRGHFSIKSERKWGFIILIPHDPPPTFRRPGSLVVQHDGYESKVLQLGYDWTTKTAAKTDKIWLKLTSVLSAPHCSATHSVPAGTTGN